MSNISNTRSQSGRRFLQSAGVFVAATGLLVGCAGNARTLPAAPERSAQSAPFDGPISPAEQARIAAMIARVKAKLANGYVFASTGTATSAIVRAGGSSSILLGSGHFVEVRLVPKSEGGDRITFDGPKGRSPQN